MEKKYGMHKLVGLQLFWSRTPNFSSGTPTFCQMGVLNSYFQNSSESSVTGSLNFEHYAIKIKSKQTKKSCMTDNCVGLYTGKDCLYNILTSNTVSLTIKNILLTVKNLGRENL